MDKKKVLAVLGRVATGVGMGIALGIPLYFVILYCLFGILPMYAAQAVIVLSVAVWLAAVLTAARFLSKKWVKRLWLAVLALAACGALWMVRGAYIDSIPKVEDRGLMLSRYEPFAEDTLAVSLDEPSALKFDTLPFAMDGATALYPVYSAFVRATCPQGDYSWPARDYDYYDGIRSGPNAVACTGTNDAYERLTFGETDLIFAAAPSQNQIDRARENGVEFHLTPVGREAFVFFVNAKNPVTGLTVEEIQKIYTGEITNWSQVGGKRQRIVPYQRRENSGSQSALLRLMDGLPLLEPETELTFGGMGGIIEGVADYRNFPNAIGFTFRYYAQEMVGNGNIRLLALDGVEPTKETIRDGSYPISDPFFAVTASPIGEPAPEESNKDLAAFLDWIRSPQGQELVDKTGYVALN